MENKTQTGSTGTKKAQNSADATETPNENTGTANTNTGNNGSNGKNLKKLFESCLQDTYNAEQQLVKALPDMAKAAFNEDLQDAFNDHLEQTKRHVARLEKIFQALRVTPGGETCEAMQGLIEEAQETIKEYGESDVRDTALIINAQKVEHYEIAAYGSLCELADVLGLNKIADLLDRTLQEEKDADRTLTDIARHVNDEAYAASSDSDKFY